MRTSLSLKYSDVDVPTHAIDSRISVLKNIIMIILSLIYMNISNANSFALNTRRIKKSGNVVQFGVFAI